MQKILKTSIPKTWQRRESVNFWSETWDERLARDVIQVRKPEKSDFFRSVLKLLWREQQLVAAL